MNRNLLHKLALTSLMILVVLSTGCKKVEEDIVVDNEADTIIEVEASEDPDEIMKEFYQMINGDETIKNVTMFVINSIENLDLDKADTMILDYEGYLIRDLNILLKQYENANSKPELSRIFDSGIKENMASLEDADLKDLLNRSLDSGYLILKGEGYIYPEIDYSEILKFKEYITRDVAGYLEIMDVEAKNRFTYGEEIEITLKDLLDRALSAETYLVSNVGSRTSNKIYNLYSDYMNGVILGGGNHYKLANEGTSIIKDEILDEYKVFVDNNKESRTAEFLRELIKILEENNNDMDAIKVIEFYNNTDLWIKDIFMDLNL